MSPLTIKLAVGAVLLAAIFGLGWHLGGLKGQADVARLERDQAQALAKAYSDREVKESAYEKEINQLKTDSLQFPTVAVRLCPSAPMPAAKGPVLPAKNVVGTGDPQPVPQSQGPDYGPSLFGLADALDSIAAQCRED